MVPRSRSIFVVKTATLCNPSVVLLIQAFLTALANQLQIQPYQIIVERAAQGSILLDTNMVPTVGNMFQSEDATRVEDVLLGRNGQALRMNQTQFGRVVVTRVTPPALLSRKSPFKWGGFPFSVLSDWELRTRSKPLKRVESGYWLPNDSARKKDHLKGSCQVLLRLCHHSWCE
jgi:hypothetical protein